jgi:hypothetical protein
MMDDTPNEPKSDLEQWKPLVEALTKLRDDLREIQLANNQRMLDRIDSNVLQSECSEANEVINYIMRK